MRRMPNTDKIKAARGGKDLKYGKKVEAIHDAARIKHDDEKRVHGHQQQLRRFEDAGYGVATGKQHEHEENMRFLKAKLDAKKAASKAFRRDMEAEANHYDESPGIAPPMGDAAEPPPVPGLRFDVGSRVLCRTGPTSWAAGRVVQLRYREPTWPRGRIAPYQVALDDGDLIFAPADDEEVIRLYSGKAPMPPVPPSVMQQPEQHQQRRRRAEAIDRIDARYHY